MSRYTLALSEAPRITLHYGFDRPLNAFFYQVTDERQGDDGEDGLVKDECGLLTSMPSSELADVLVNANAPVEHIAAVMLNMPF